MTALSGQAYQVPTFGTDRIRLGHKEMFGSRCRGTFSTTQRMSGLQQRQMEHSDGDKEHFLYCDGFRADVVHGDVGPIQT
jgi:hypothetical protein